MPPTLPPPPEFLDKSCGDRIPVWVTATRNSGTTGTHADNATRTRPNDGLTDTSSCQPGQREPPAARLAQCSVKPDATAVIIGDSILRDMQGNKMATTPGERVQIISVSGLTAVDLTEWLLQQKPAPHAETVTLHVGVNDCKISEVTSKQWEDLVTQCRRVFPRARLQASTIIPAKGRHVLNQTISPSNSSLCHVCRKMGVTLINNTATFTAVSGAPRLALYRDHIHPSYKGMIRLAGNIKRAGRPDEDTAGHHRGDTDDRPAGTTKRATYASAVDRQQPPAPAGTSYSSESRIPHSQAETHHLQQQQHQEHTSPHQSPVSYPGQLQPYNGFYQPATPVWQNYLHGTPVPNTQNLFSAVPPFSVPAFHSWPHFHQFDDLSNPVRVF
ncbi:hypothetical protein BaRGS_00010120 [Batillaria attramentaria]|uniref:SGNH hydrolase-type esterase domain-containing protein n=1 Tax=Batillaria attramentaria TaxID=370345 RepID=A0ABD0LH61_9CAEN